MKYKSLKYRRKDNIIFSTLDNEICIFDPISAEYINLNSTGSLIWNVLENFKTIEEIANDLVKEFDISYKDCEYEVYEFIKKLQLKNFLDEYQLN